MDDENTSPTKTPAHLWRHQYKNKPQYSKALYFDTTKSFENIFHSSSNIPNDENIMMIAHVNQPDTHSFFVPKQNTSEENVVGSKYLLVPPGGGVSSAINEHIPTENPATCPNAHSLQHPTKLPHHPTTRV